jgi:hypothetical protein
MTDAAHLERSYRCLLLAYPARYRRHHGSEIVTTLLEMSPPGRRRPTTVEAGHLLAGGLRQRFRLPARRPLPWIAAVLVTLVLGAFGAATGSWIAAQTYAALPERAGFSAVSRLIDDGVDRWEQRDATPHAVTSWESVVDDPGWTAAAGRDRLRAAGWQVTAVRPLVPGGESAGPGGQLLPVTRTSFDATRDGLHLRVVGSVTAEHGNVWVAMWPESTRARWPLTVAGTVLGLLIGWPLAAALSYRLRRMPARPARVAAVAAGLSLTALTGPALACYANLGLMVRAARAGEIPVTVHSALSAGPFETYGWRWMMLELAVTGLLLGAAAITLAARGGEAERAPSLAAS